MKNTEKLLDRDCAKNGEYAQDVIRLLHSAFAKAADLGVPRKMIAIRIRSDQGKLDAWTAPSHPHAISSSTLLELIVRDDVLPDAARRSFFGAIATMAGFTVCDDTEEDTKPPAEQITEIAAAVGSVATRFTEATAPRSEAGRLIGREEKAATVEALDELIAQAQQLRSAVVRGVRR